MIKILIVCSSLNGGGAEFVARKNIECFIKNSDFSVAVATCDYTEYKFSKEINTYYLQDFRNVDSNIKKSISSLGIEENYNVMCNAIKDFKPDIIHFHNYIPFTHTLLKAVKDLKKKLNYKIIMTHHTYSYICTNDSLYNYSKEKLCEKCIGRFDTSIIKHNCSNNIKIGLGKYLQKNRINSQLSGLIDLNISPSEFLKNKILEAYPKEKIEIVRNPCLSLENDSKYESKKDLIVYFGRLSYEKNILRFIELFSNSNSKYELLIIGNGELEKQTDNLCRKDKRITFINSFLSTEQLYKEIRIAKFMILPSIWYENSPVSIVEAISLHVIPIVNNIGGMKELIDMFEFGVAYKTEDELTRLLNNLDSLFEVHKLDANKKDLLNEFFEDAYRLVLSNIYSNLISNNNFKMF